MTGARRWIQLISGLVMCYGMALSLHWFYFPTATDRPSIWIIGGCILLGAAGLLPVQVEFVVKTARDFMPFMARNDADRRSGEERRTDHEQAAAWPVEHERRAERREIGEGIE